MGVKMRRNVLFIVCIVAVICIMATIFTIQNRKEPNLLTEFKEIHPDSIIVAYAVMNIDDIGDADIVILFKDHTLVKKNPNVNVAFITQDTVTIVGLYPDDPEYEFANNKDILKIQENPKKINILIQNTATNEIIDYYVEINYDKENLSLDLVTGIEK